MPYEDLGFPRIVLVPLSVLTVAKGSRRAHPDHLSDLFRLISIGANSGLGLHSKYFGTVVRAVPYVRTDSPVIVNGDFISFVIVHFVRDAVFFLLSGKPYLCMCPVAKRLVPRASAPAECHHGCCFKEHSL